MMEAFYNRINDYGSVSIRLASPEDIRRWSFGEVKKPETINYRTYRSEKDGLFCERIFGPERDWECSCGKYKGIKHKGIKCDRCGVEVTHSRVRRKRMGHITLAAPVAHIWFFKALPSRLGALLGKKTSSLERVIYFQDYIVTDPGDTGLKERELMTEEQYREARDRYGDAFEAGMGAEAIQEILDGLDLDQLIDEIYHNLRETRSKQKTKDLVKRLKITKAIRDSGNEAKWMTMGVIPVIPPDLRPLVLLESGNFATSDLNDLYRRLINRNNRLKKLLDLNAPEVIIRNEKRMLQQSVDALFDNNRCRRPVNGSNSRPLKSLTDMIKGKQGRFRENLLGKRVDYSARSVIVVGPELKLHQCGLPKKIALELFQPFIIRRLKELGHAETIKIARKMLERKDEEVWDILEEVINDHPVLLNRAPTLHRMGIQAFEPILIEGNAIKLHPLVCTGFNADFDGDQMAVHLPLSYEAQVEATTLMLATNNVFSPANGQPIIAPSQDIVLGCYYLTCGNDMEKGEDLRRPYATFEEVEMAWSQGKVTLQTRIKVRLPEGMRVMVLKSGDREFLSAEESKVIETTVGRCVFHDIIPAGMPFYNYPLKKGRLMEIIADSHKYLGRKATLELLDELKDLGFKHATLAGLSFATYDLKLPARKVDLLEESNKAVAKIQKQYARGVITDLERYNQIIDEWTRATERVGEEMIGELRNDVRDGKPYLNPVYLMAISGARGSHQQIRQLAGMRGLMAKPSGKIIETPIKANFREGLHVLEYFSSTHGARKGLADTALKTADSGYLTRKLADIGQNVVVNERDCGTQRGITKGAVFNGEMVEVPFWKSVRGRTARDTIVDVVTDEVIVREDELITEDIARKIQDTLSKKGKIRVRSPLTCETPIGVCAKCYGMDLSLGKLVEEGLAVGIIAAQSIGEPGTQLTMRTFHIGGVAHAKRQESDVYAKTNGEVRYEYMNVESVDDELVEIEGKGKIHVVSPKGITLESYDVPLGAKVKIGEGDKVKGGNAKRKGTLLFEWDPHMEPILALKGGRVEYEGIIEGVTMRREKDSKTKLEYKVIMEHKGDHHPMVVVRDPSGATISSYPIPEGAHLEVDPGDECVPGSLLAKTPREVGGTQDITGGLPRVTEIFEVRKPKTPAVMAEIDGQVEIGAKKRGKGTIIIRSESGAVVEHTYQHGRQLRVHTGDRVKAGDPLTRGNMIPHDILRICGAEALNQYLLLEVQKVYRSQNVTIDDKHIEIVIMQMTRKVQVVDTGDTEFLPGQIIDKFHFQSHNKAIRARGGKPATAEPLLLGITKASLFSESFISAASFQETTKVLTEAALAGKEDRLLGLKENVILGHLVPAGTGYKGYHACVVEKFIPESEQGDETESVSLSLGGDKLD